MVDNYNVKNEEFANLFGSQKRKRELAAAKAEIDSLKTSQAVLQGQIASQIVPQSSTSILSSDSQANKPNLLLWGGVALVVVVGGILLINRK